MPMIKRIKNRQEAKEKRLIVFDGDDTLWETIELYRESIGDFIYLMARQGFKEADVIKRFDQIDVGNVKKLGFTVNRFSASMVQTYAGFCRAQRKKYLMSVAKQCRDIAYSIVLKKAPVVKGTRSILKSLKERGFELALITKGTKSLQTKRIIDSGLKKYFDKIYIVPKKDKKIFKKKLSSYMRSGYEIWMIGDSLQSDILPSLELGFKSIWLQKKTWTFEESTIFKKKIKIIRNLKDVLNLL